MSTTTTVKNRGSGAVNHKHPTPNDSCGWRQEPPKGPSVSANNVGEKSLHQDHLSQNNNAAKEEKENHHLDSNSSTGDNEKGSDTSNDHPIVVSPVKKK
jgi:hypothetical protein